MPPIAMTKEVYQVLFCSFLRDNSSLHDFQVFSTLYRL